MNKNKRYIVNNKMENFNKLIPKCQICDKPMKNAYDSKLKKVSSYLWQTTCEHDKNLRLSIG